MKELLYNISTIEKNNSFRFDYPSDFIEKLTVSAETLTTFYNNYIAINLIETAETEQLPENEKKTLQQIKTAWKKEKDKDKIKLIDTLKTLYFK